MGNDGSCDAGSSEYLFDELPFFQPRQEPNGTLYVVDPNEQKGCVYRNADLLPTVCVCAGRGVRVRSAETFLFFV
jgi:hypothetical protein